MTALFCKPLFFAKKEKQVRPTGEKENEEGKRRIKEENATDKKNSSGKEIQNLFPCHNLKHFLSDVPRQIVLNTSLTRFS